MNIALAQMVPLNENFYKNIADIFERLKFFKTSLVPTMNTYTEKNWEGQQ